jgi:heat-inducible transcriptional repressor
MTGAIDAGLATAYILNAMITELNERSRDILRLVVEAYVETGGPIGSRTLSQRLNQGLSAATIRNAMADLEDAGLLYAPHTSAGRLPTDMGVRLFVDGLLQSGQLNPTDREAIEGQCQTAGRSVTQVLEEASSLMSGLSRCAGLVMAPQG